MPKDIDPLAVLQADLANKEERLERLWNSIYNFDRAGKDTDEMREMAASLEEEIDFLRAEIAEVMG